MTMPRKSARCAVSCTAIRQDLAKAGAEARTYRLVHTGSYIQTRPMTKQFVCADPRSHSCIGVTYRSARTSASGVLCGGLGPSLFQLRVRVRQGLRDEGTKAMLRYVRIWKAMFDYIAQQFEGQVWERRRHDSAIKRLLPVPFGAFPARAFRE